MSDLANDIMSDLTIPVEVLKSAEAVPTPPSAAPVTPEATPAPVPVPVAAPAEPQAKQEAIPMPVALDWRDRMKAAERELATLKSQPAPQVPSAVQDPEAFARYQADLVNSTRTNTVFDMSEVMAREKHGDEPVSKAMAWAAEKAAAEKAALGFSPFAAEYLQQKHPIDWAVKQQKRHALLAEIGDDPESYITKQIAARSAAPAAALAQPSPAASPQPTAPIPAQQPTPTRSLASAPTAGAATSVPSHPLAAIDAVFR